MNDFTFRNISDFSELIYTAIDSIEPEKTTLWLTISKNNKNRARNHHCAKLLGVLLDSHLIESDTSYPSTFANENTLATTVQDAIIANLFSIYQWLQTSSRVLELQAPITYTLTTGKTVQTTGIVLQDKLAGIDFIASGRANIVLITDPSSQFGFKLWTAYPSPATQAIIERLPTRTHMTAIHQSSICQQSASARAYAIGRITKNKQFCNTYYVPAIDAISVKKVFGFSKRGVDQDVAYIRPDGIFINIVRRGILANHILGSSSPKRALDITRNKNYLEAWIEHSPVSHILLRRCLNISRLVHNCANEIKMEQDLKSISKETAIVLQSKNDILNILNKDF